MSCITWLDNRIRTVCGGMLTVRGVKLVGAKTFTSQSGHVIEFADPPIWASDPYFDPANPSSITVPPGLGGRYYLHATFKWTKASNADFSEVESNKGYFYAQFECTSNGNRERLIDTRHTAAPVAEAALTSQVIVWEGDLESGDTLELRAHDFVVGVDPTAVHSDLLNVWVCVRRL